MASPLLPGGWQRSPSAPPPQLFRMLVSLIFDLVSSRYEISDDSVFHGRRYGEDRTVASVEMVDGAVELVLVPANMGGPSSLSKLRAVGLQSVETGKRCYVSTVGPNRIRFLSTAEGQEAAPGPLVVEIVGA